jgi:hypothetical protein
VLEPTAVVPPHTGHGTLAPAHLPRAWLRLAWAMFAQVGKHADLLPLGRGALCAVSPARGCGPGGGVGGRGTSGRWRASAPVPGSARDLGQTPV